jgi:hypothetical protein
VDSSLVLILVLTFMIHLVDTLAYAVSLAAVRTRRLAVSFSLFNVLVLGSRTAATFQAPLLARRVETAALSGQDTLLPDLRLVLLAATLATIVGALLIPTFQNAFTRAVRSFDIHRSVPRLIVRAFSKAGLLHLRDSLKAPDPHGVIALQGGSRVPLHILAVNAVSVAAWSIAILAALYAGFLAPDYRMTTGSLAAVVSGIATILIFLINDPYLSALTDDVLEGKVSEGFFRRSLVWLVGSRAVGTLLAQLMLVPAALLIAGLAQRI